MDITNRPTANGQHVPSRHSTGEAPRPTLQELARIFSSDKYYRHSYIETYQRLFQDRKVYRLLELGIGYEGLMKPFLPEGVEYCHGSSLKMWSTYWPEAEIWGCDIREDTLFNQGNIRTVQCDQSSGHSLAELVWVVTDGLQHKLDFICDDGSHVLEHQKLTASVLLPRLAEGGVYIIEDTYPDKGDVLARMFGGELIIGGKTPDDCLVVIQK